MTDIAIHERTGLAISSDQATFSAEQRAVLAHMGVENAPEADLRVFMHVCQRSGLDPFARQIHMIGRNSKNQRTDQWETKYTIQTGIDGYRLIGRRAADRARVSISIGQPEWAHEDGTWRPVWSKSWGVPVAARVTIERDGKPFTAVALFDEYKQTKRDGNLTSMWAQRPAGQLAKCCEALAWRMAFPQDLSGIYTDDEMGQADRHDEPTVTHAPAVSASDFLAQPVADATDAEVLEDEPQPEPKLSARNRGRLFALFTQKGIPEAEQLAGIARVIGRTPSHRDAINEDEFARVVHQLESLPDAEVAK